MKNEKHITPDELFHQNLEGMEVPYDEAAWQNMADLLDRSETKRPFFWWFRKNKKTTLLLTLISTIMLTTTFIMLLNLNMNTSPADMPVSSANVPNAKANETETLRNKSEYNYSASDKENAAVSNNGNSYEYNSNPNIAAENTYMPAAAKGSKTEVKTGGTNIGAGKTETTNVAAPAEENTIGGNSPENSAATAEEPVKTNAVTTVAAQTTTAVKTSQTVVKTSNPTPLIAKKDYDKVDGPFHGPWLGLHFTAQYPQSPLLKDSWRQNAGFNFQLMSNNLTGRRDFGGYLGFDFGVQWTGRGKSSGVELNNSAQDSGFTRLNSSSVDFFARGHFEYAKYRLKPYINVFGGPRLFAVNQYTEAYHHKTDYDNSSSNNAFSSASLMYGAGVGVRYRLGKVVSFDVRYDFMQGTETNMVNVDRSKFNGLTYDLSKFKVTPAYTQLRVGFLFDLVAEEKTAHKEEQEQVTEYYRFDSTTNMFVKVQCNCRQWPVTDTSANTNDSIIVVKRSRSGSTNSGWNPGQTGWGTGSGSTGGTRGGSSGSGGSGRGSFPGIKPGGGGIKPKS